MLNYMRCYHRQHCMCCVDDWIGICIKFVQIDKLIIDNLLEVLYFIVLVFLASELQVVI